MSIFDKLEKKLDDMNSAMRVSDVDSSSLVGRKAFLTDPYLEVSSSQGTWRAKFTRLSNRMLREAATRDTIMASILRHRRTQIEAFCNIPNTRFDTGFTFVRRDGRELDSADHSDIEKLSQWLYFCGEVAKTPLEDRSTMATQFGMMTQDVLTFGHAAIEKVRDKLGGLQRIRHVPGESIFHATKSAPNEQIEATVNSYKQTLPKEYVPVGKVTPDTDNDVKYLQIINAKEVASFSDQTLTFKLFQPPSYVDNNGFSTSLVETCIIAITRHLQAENYNALFFTHGFAARGLLHLKGNVSQANLQMFRNQFNAAINGNNNSWRTPIVAGLDGVDWIPLAGTSRDMEYIQFTDHLIRTICSQAQIDPTEIGFEYLSRGTQQSTLNSPNNEWKLTASQERGLIPLLRFFEDLVNHDILPEISPDLANKYMFKFIGLQSETKQQEITRLQAEMSVHASLNDLRRQVKKEPLDKSTAAEIPLNALWWNTAKELLTVGELRELLLGDEGASKRPELQYIPSPTYLGYQQFLMSKDQAAQQQQQMEEQQKAQETQDKMNGLDQEPATPPVR
jgi:hypothetical protein